MNSIRFDLAKKDLARRLRGVLVSSCINDSIAKVWNHYSDHLPIGGVINERHRVGSSNILQHKALSSHLPKIPGWKDSSLVALQLQPSERYPGVSKREELAIDHIIRLMVEDRVFNTLCLQECSDRVLKILKHELEPFPIAVMIGDGKRDLHVATLVNTESYTIEEAHVRPAFRRHIEKLGGLVQDVWRPAVDVTLVVKQDRQLGFPEKFRSVNVHVSSAGQSEVYKVDRLKEIGLYLRAFPDSRAIAAVSGDFNAERPLIDEAFGEISQGLCTHFTQVECIPVDHPKVVSIDDHRAIFPEGTSPAIFDMKSMSLHAIDPAISALYDRMLHLAQIKES